MDTILDISSRGRVCACLADSCLVSQGFECSTVLAWIHRSRFWYGDLWLKWHTTRLWWEVVGNEEEVRTEWTNGKVVVSVWYPQENLIPRCSLALSQESWLSYSLEEKQSGTSSSLHLWDLLRQCFKVQGWTSQWDIGVHCWKQTVALFAVSGVSVIRS